MESGHIKSAKVEPLRASVEIPTRPASAVELTRTLVESPDKMEVLKITARQNFQTLEMTAREIWEKEEAIPVVENVKIYTSWSEFCEENGLKKRQDFSRNNSVKELSIKNKARWAGITGLQDFRFDVVNQGDVLEAYKNAKRVIKLQGGWCSSREIMQELAESILAQDPDAFVIILDHPGQKDSNLLHPNDISRDPTMASLTQNLLSTDLSLRLFGLADDQIIADNKEVVKIVHSREAAAHLFSKSMENSKIKHAILAPVLGHAGLKPGVGQNLLNFAMTVAGVLENVRVTDGMVRYFSEIITKAYTGAEHTGLIEKYMTSLRVTDKGVLAAYIYNLYKVDFPNLKGVKFDPERLLVQIYDGDLFVNSPGMLKQFGENVDGSVIAACVKNGPGDHHEFANTNSWAHKALMDFVRQ